MTRFCDEAGRTIRAVERYLQNQVASKRQEEKIFNLAHLPCPSLPVEWACGSRPGRLSVIDSTTPAVAASLAAIGKVEKKKASFGLASTQQTIVESRRCLL